MFVTFNCVHCAAAHAVFPERCRCRCHPTVAPLPVTANAPRTEGGQS